MNIGEAAKLTGLSIKQIRDYEKSGLLTNTLRSEAGYRIYNESDINRLKFIANARKCRLFALTNWRAIGTQRQPKPKKL